MLRSPTHCSSSSWRTKALVLVLFFAPGEAQTAEPRPQSPPQKILATVVDGACTPAETWKFGVEIQSLVPALARVEFESFLRSQDSPFRGYAEARSVSALPHAVVKNFSRYWTGRAFYKAGLYGPAISQFNSLLEQPLTSASLPLQLAAMACLVRIHKTYPVTVFSEKAVANLPAYFEPGLVPRASQPILWETGVHLMMRRIKSKTAKEGLANTVKLLHGAGPYEDFARLTVATAEEKPEGAKILLSRLVTATDLPSSIENLKNDIRLILARVHYAEGRYPEAAKILDSVDKQNNAFVQSLHLRSWVELARENYTDAIGASFSLQSGAFKETFVPEAWMVAAISLVEICQFPAALRTVGTFKKNYEFTYQWLREHTENKASQSEPLYPRAVSYLRGKRSGVPQKVISEWIKSPAFLRGQQAINFSFRETKKIPKLIAQADNYVAAKAAEIEVFIATADENVLRAASESAESDEDAVNQEKPIERTLANEVAKVSELKNAEAMHQRLTEALPHWQAALDSYDELALEQRDQIMGNIEAEFRALNKRLLSRLEAVMSNNELIEAEIYSGAGTDLVRQNANAELTPAKNSDRRNYDWVISRRKDGKEEVWEDELGTMKAKLENYCAKTKKQFEPN